MNADFSTPVTAAADSTSVDLETVRRMISARGIKTARFWFTSLGGCPWRIAMPPDFVGESGFSKGTPLDGRLVGGAWDGVKLLVPKLDAVYADPTASAPSLAVFGDVLDPLSKEALAFDPRRVLERAARRVEERLGAKLALGAEPEFILLQPVGAPAAETVVWEFLRALAVSLGDAGIRVDWFRTGPTAGQGRVQMRTAPLLLMADRVMLYRHFAAALSQTRALSIGFLPRPLASGGAPGMPAHLSLWKDGENLFHDSQDRVLATPLCRAFAAGLLRHLRSLATFCAPTIDAYRPPARSPAADLRRVIFCRPISASNPYLAFASVLLAGLDGIERHLESPADGGQPLRARMPHSLQSALESLDEDRGYLTAGDVFSDALIEAWIKDAGSVAGKTGKTGAEETSSS